MRTITSVISIKQQENILLASEITENSNPKNETETIPPKNGKSEERKIWNALPKVKTSAKSVQTTRVVCTNYG